MQLQPTPTLIENLYWITIVALVVSSASGVLQAGFRRFDLFGMIIIGITTGIGGGSVRDMLLGKQAFWIVNQEYFIVAVLSSVLMFIIARRWAVNPSFFLIPDAAGLAAYSIAGTLAALMFGAPWFVASFMGVLTGIMGGVLRDILCNEPPVVFQSSLYGTIAWVGSLLFIGLLYLDWDITWATLAAGLLMFCTRVVAMKYDIGLPKFRFKTE
ncbi:trimeric intracellular cation channel family protein [Thiomicrorhabdus sediminis]|uniref:Trimeric intracellular cation channel family protein n=1 Tax=Thiomicrorhabdus sediminis TaxID=2580412 RepID=A0A4P9K6I9_9GAMM|nr:trimeric intracellular cation channel family protein [Thiomicrorhabdus sediminis]QCU90665.1 trimeric intracellular cation channel family protein [Thiomicrorhabdus sediminis]